MVAGVAFSGQTNFGTKSQLCNEIGCKVWQPIKPVESRRHEPTKTQIGIFHQMGVFLAPDFKRAEAYHWYIPPDWGVFLVIPCIVGVVEHLVCQSCTIGRPGHARTLWF